MTHEKHYTQKLTMPHTEIIIGSSGCGKTYYLIHQLESILRNNPGLKKVYIICPTIDNNKAFKTWGLPAELFRKVKYIGCSQNNVNEELQEVIDVCGSPQNKGDEDNPRNIIVLDDCAQGTDVKGRSGPLVSLAFNARHIGLGVIVVTQQLTSITRPYRENITRVITFFTMNRQGNNLMFDEFMGSSDKHERKQIMHKLKTHKYSYLYVDGINYIHHIVI